MGLVDKLRDDGGYDWSSHDGWFLPNKAKRHAFNAFIINRLDLFLILFMRLKSLVLSVDQSG